MESTKSIMESKKTIRFEQGYALIAIFANSCQLAAFCVKDTFGSSFDEKHFFPHEPRFAETFNLLSTSNSFANECRDIIY